MTLSLGVDTGGTYTDAVIYDHENRQLLAKNKVLTTHHDLLKGIISSIEGLERSFLSEIDFASFSTTLATNAIVEGRGAEVGLLLLGMNISELRSYNFQHDIPTDIIDSVGGRMDVDGTEKESLEVKKIEEIALKWQGKIEAAAVTGYMSVRNPAQEKKTAEILSEHMDYPLVLSHELTGKLNMIERAATSVLNASLIPIMVNLTSRLEEALKEMELSVPLYIMKGDGSLVSHEYIKERPVETVISGPAASALGGRHLSQSEEAVIIDMGGTTTDIVPVHADGPRINRTGAEVEGWSTSIEAADLKTAGIGGDSSIIVSSRGEIEIGPESLTPYSLAAAKSDQIKDALLEKLPRLIENKIPVHLSQFLSLNRPPRRDELDLSRREKNIIELLRPRPRPLIELKEELDLIRIKFLQSERLERQGIISRIGLTPTDSLHVISHFERWHSETAELGFELLQTELKRKTGRSAAGITELNKIELAEHVREQVVEIVAINLVRQLLRSEPKERNLSFEDEDLIRAFWQEFSGYNLSFQAQKPLIALGAPAENYLPLLKEFIDIEVILPENHEIANALGTAVAGIVQEERFLIKQQNNSFTLHYSQGRKKIKSYHKALEKAEELGREITGERVKRAGGKKIEFTCHRKERGDNRRRTAVICQAIGKPV